MQLKAAFTCKKCSKLFGIQLRLNCLWQILYKVCHGFRFTTRNDYFRVNFDHFWIEQYWKSARAYELQTATKLSFPKFVKLTVWHIKLRFILAENGLWNWLVVFMPYNIYSSAFVLSTNWLVKLTIAGVHILDPIRIKCIAFFH